MSVYDLWEPVEDLDFWAAGRTPEDLIDHMERGVTRVIITLVVIMALLVAGYLVFGSVVCGILALASCLFLVVQLFAAHDVLQTMEEM